MTVIKYANLFHPRAFSKRPSTRAIILHHAVMNGGVKDVNQIHLNRLFNGIGYHYYIRKDGSIWAGRPLWAVGAGVRHLGYYGNSNTIHVCSEGNFEVEHMGEKQFNGVVEVVKQIRQQYSELPLLPHRSINPTACPGRLYPMDKIISESKEVNMSIRYLVQIPTKIDNICEIRSAVEKATGYKFYINPDFTLNVKASESSLREIISKSPYKVYYKEIT